MAVDLVGMIRQQHAEEQRAEARLQQLLSIGKDSVPPWEAGRGPPLAADGPGKVAFHAISDFVGGAGPRDPADTSDLMGGQAGAGGGGGILRSEDPSRRVSSAGSQRPASRKVAMRRELSNAVDKLKETGVRLSDDDLGVVLGGGKGKDIGVGLAVGARAKWRMAARLAIAANRHKATRKTKQALVKEAEEERAEAQALQDEEARDEVPWVGTEEEARRAAERGWGEWITSGDDEMLAAWEFLKGEATPRVRSSSAFKGQGVTGMTLDWQRREVGGAWRPYLVAAMADKQFRVYDAESLQVSWGPGAGPRRGPRPPAPPGAPRRPPAPPGAPRRRQAPHALPAHRSCPRSSWRASRATARRSPGCGR